MPLGKSRPEVLRLITGGRGDRTALNSWAPVQPQWVALIEPPGEWELPMGLGQLPVATPRPVVKLPGLEVPY